MTFLDPVFAHLGLLTAILCGLLAAVQAVRVLLAISAWYWPTVSGAIDTLEYQEVDGEGAGGSIPRVSYRYSIAGRTYTGKRLWLTPRLFANYSRMVDRLGTILPGREHPVRVLPFWPRFALLLPGTNACEIACLAFLVILTFAFAIPWGPAGS